VGEEGLSSKCEWAWLDERRKGAAREIAVKCDRLGYLLHCIFLRWAIISGRKPKILFNKINSEMVLPSAFFQG
jgi:hypothetical protein